MNPTAWRATLAATALMGLAMGNRASFGLFISPLNSATGIGLATISLAAALGQLALGFTQPAVAALAEKHGAARVMAAGTALLVVGTAALAQVHETWALMALMLLTALGCSAMGSNAMLMGEVGRRVPAARQGFASGLVGAGGSAGQLLLAPATQIVILAFGWQTAMWATAAAMLLALPLLRPFAAAPAAAEQTADGGTAAAGISVREALRDRRLWIVAAGFTACGFHVAFLSTHMPGVFERCGLPPTLAGVGLALIGAANIAGSVTVGLLMKRHASPLLLALLYGTRAAAIAVMLLLTPTAPVMLVFAVVMGFTYIAPLAPTAQLLAQYFGVRRLGTLFGVVMVAHQIGGFAGAWLGGVAAEHTGSYRPLWLADIALALLAAALQWPLRERRPPAATADARAVRPAAARAAPVCAARRAPRGA